MYPKILTIGLSVLAMTAAGLASAATVSVSHVVNGTDNLYNTSWGHPYDQQDALGTPATAVGSNDGGEAINFSGIDTLFLSADGCVTDDGANRTFADGSLCGDLVDDNSIWLGNEFREFTAYALIGLWSVTPDVISYVTVGDDPNSTSWLDAIFEVGSSAEIAVPNAPHFDQLYLFLANNDGLFSDNAGAYDVTIRYHVAEVPTPGTAALFGLGLALLGLSRRLAR